MNAGRIVGWERRKKDLTQRTQSRSAENTEKSEEKRVCDF
jgi:hypothetical protein